MLRPTSHPAHYFTYGSLQWLSLIAIEVNPSHTTTTASGPGVDLGVVFFIGLQSILLKAHIRSLDDKQRVLWWWEDVVVVWQMGDPDVIMTWE